MYDYIDTNKYNIIVDCKLTFVAGIIYINDIFIIQPSICLPKEFWRYKRSNKKSEKDMQYHGQKKKDKRTNNDLQNIHIELKIE